MSVFLILFFTSGHTGQGLQGRTTPLFTLAKQFNTFFAFIFFTYSRKYFCLYIAKCQSLACVILILNAIAVQKNPQVNTQILDSYYHFLQLNRCHGYFAPPKFKSQNGFFSQQTFAGFYTLTTLAYAASGCII